MTRLQRNQTTPQSRAKAKAQLAKAKAKNKALGQAMLAAPSQPIRVQAPTIEEQFHGALLEATGFQESAVYHANQVRLSKAAAKAAKQRAIDMVSSLTIDQAQKVLEHEDPALRIAAIQRMGQ